MNTRAFLAMLLIDEATMDMARYLNKAKTVQEIDRSVVLLYELRIMLERELGGEVPNNVVPIDKKKRD